MHIRRPASKVDKIDEGRDRLNPSRDATKSGGKHRTVGEGKIKKGVQNIKSPPSVVAPSSCVTLGWDQVGTDRKNALESTTNNVFFCIFLPLLDSVV